MALLEIRNLTKRYGVQTAVDDLSFSLQRGERFGLLGPNGAGKTTTISLIVGAAKADSGTIFLDGKPIGNETDQMKKRIGFVPQELALYDDLTAVDNLRLFGALYGLKGSDMETRIQEELEAVGLTDRAKSRVRTYSGGMKRRLNIAAGLLHRPELLILDEPTVGVDPQSRNAIFDGIERLTAAGITLLYTTHYMEEVERLCDRVVIMDKGKIMADGTQAELRALLPARASRLLIEIAPASQPCLTEELRERLQMIGEVSDAVFLPDGRLAVSVANLATAAPAVLTLLNERSVTYTAVTTERPNLEEVFLHLTGRSLRDE